jgi:hypothetical protein
MMELFPTVQGATLRIHRVECSARKDGRVKRAADLSQSGKRGIRTGAKQRIRSGIQIDRAELPPVVMK